MVGAFVNQGLLPKAARIISTTKLPRRQEVFKSFHNIGPGALVSNVKLFNRASFFVPSGTRQQHHAAMTFSSPLVSAGEVSFPMYSH